jgi:hypothetical protein
MSKSDELSSRGPVIYVTPVPNREGSFMCSIKKNKNPSEDEKTCEIIAMGMMRIALSDPSYVYDLGLEALEEENYIDSDKPIVKSNGSNDETKIIDILDYLKFKSTRGKLN